MTLAEAVSQLITFGERDPYLISQKLCERHKDEQWFLEEIVAYADDFVADMARRQLGAMRRTAEHAVRRTDEATQRRLGEVSTWLPETGYKRLKDCTADELRDKASYYSVLARANWAKAAFYNRLAELVEFEGVATLGDVQSPLPEMPHGVADDDRQTELAA